MADHEICESGVWVDTQSGQVVTTQPVEGTQLIAPGSVVTPDQRAAVELAGGSLDPTPEVAVPEVVETAADAPEVETAAVETKTTTRRKR